MSTVTHTHIHAHTCTQTHVHAHTPKGEISWWTQVISIQVHWLDKYEDNNISFA